MKFLNSIKINFAIKLNADQKMIKKYTPTAMNRNMQKIRWTKNYEILKQTEKQNFNWKTMYNVEKNFKKNNPDARIRKAKNDWCDQLNDCHDALQTLNENVLFAKFEIIRFFDEKKIKRCCICKTILFMHIDETWPFNVDE